MSAHKKKGVVAAKSSGIVVGDAKVHGGVKFQAKLWGVILGCVLVVALLGFGGVKVYQHFHKSNNLLANTQSGVSQTPVEKVRTAAEAGDYKTAEAYISQQAGSAKTDQDKAGWYVQAYVTATNAQQYTDALGYAQHAYSLVADSSNAYTVAQAYEKLNDTANARKYLQLAIDKLDKTVRSYQITRNQYQQEMAGLK